MGGKRGRDYVDLIIQATVQSYLKDILIQEGFKYTTLMHKDEFVHQRGHICKLRETLTHQGDCGICS